MFIRASRSEVLRPECTGGDEEPGDYGAQLSMPLLFVSSPSETSAQYCVCVLQRITGSCQAAACHILSVKTCLASFQAGS